MSALPDRRIEAARWMRYAREDLEAARLLLDRSETPRLACAMAQQAAEKALKAALVLDDGEPPRSHNLAYIRNLLADDWSAKKLEIELSPLSEWAVAARYPGDWDEPTPAEAQNAVELAEAIVSAIVLDLAARGVDDR